MAREARHSNSKWAPLLLLALLAMPQSASACRYLGPPGASSKSIEANWAFFDHVAVLRVVEEGADRLASRNTQPDRRFGYVLFEVVKEYKGSLPKRFVNSVGMGGICGRVPEPGDQVLTFFDAVMTTGVRYESNPDAPSFATSLNWLSKFIFVSDASAADEHLRAAGVLPSQ